MDFLILIKNGCDNLTATVSPSVDSLGLHMVLSLATIMLVWFGVQEALASAQGGPGFNVAKFLNFFMLITFAYCFVKFYDSSHSRHRVFAEGIRQRRNKQSGRLHRARFDAGSSKYDPCGAQQKSELSRRHSRSHIRCSAPIRFRSSSVFSLR